jgi:hypothetical protein
MPFMLTVFNAHSVFNAQCHLCCVSFMRVCHLYWELFMLNVINDKCHCVIYANCRLFIVMPRVVTLNVMAPSHG